MAYALSSHCVLAVLLACAVHCHIDSFEAESSQYDDSFADDSLEAERRELEEQVADKRYQLGELERNERINIPAFVTVGAIYCHLLPSVWCLPCKIVS